MAFAEIIIAVAYFLHVCFAHNGQHFTPNFMANTQVESDKGNFQATADNANFRGNYINFAANHLSQSKFPQNRLSDFFNQKAATPLDHYQNSMILQNPNQQQFSNLRKQNNLETQDMPFVLGSWNSRQDPKLINNMKLTPLNELPLTSNILPAPNIANNLPAPTGNLNTQSIVPSSLTISTSLPSFVPSVFQNSNYNKVQVRNQLSYDTNLNKAFVGLSEPPKDTANTYPGSYYFVPSKSSSSSTDVNRKSLNMKTLLPLIINLLNDKSEDCPCCLQCHRFNSKNNLADIPLIDSGYSKQKTYGPPSDESYEDSESEEETNDVARQNVKRFKNRGRKQKYHRYIPNEAKESQSNED